MLIPHQVGLRALAHLTQGGLEAEPREHVAHQAEAGQRNRDRRRARGDDEKHPEGCAQSASAVLVNSTIPATNQTVRSMYQRSVGTMKTPDRSAMGTSLCGGG
jgi:hypothetical protein